MSELSTEMEIASDPIENYADMSDRELMTHIARNQDQMLGLVAGIFSQVEPLIESLQTHPLLKSFFGGK